LADSQEFASFLPLFPKVFQVDTSASRVCNRSSAAWRRTSLLKTMDSNTLAVPRTAARRRLRMFTLYADFPAGIRARRLGNQVAGLVGSDWETSAEMWKLDSVAPVGPIRDMIAQEAGESDVLMIAISSLDAPDTSVIRWLNSLVN